MTLGKALPPCTPTSRQRGWAVARDLRMTSTCITYSDRPASRPRPCASRRALPATATEPTPTDQRTPRPRPSAGMPPAIPARRAAPPSARRPAGPGTCGMARTSDLNSHPWRDRSPPRRLPGRTRRTPRATPAPAARVAAARPTATPARRVGISDARRLAVATKVTVDRSSGRCRRSGRGRRGCAAGRALRAARGPPHPASGRFRRGRTPGRVACIPAVGRPAAAP